METYRTPGTIEADLPEKKIHEPWYAWMGKPQAYIYLVILDLLIAILNFVQWWYHGGLAFILATGVWLVLAVMNTFTYRTRKRTVARLAELDVWREKWKTGQTHGN